MLLVWSQVLIILTSGITEEDSLWPRSGCRSTATNATPRRMREVLTATTQPTCCSRSSGPGWKTMPPRCISSLYTTEDQIEM